MPCDMAVMNDLVMPLAEARVSVLDMAFMRGCGAFETLRTYGGHPHELDRHVERLWEGGAAMGLEPFLPTATLRKALAQAHRASGYPETRVNMILSPGDHAGGVFGATDPRLVMLVRECVPYPDKAYREGHRLAIFDGERPLPELKTTNYMVGYEAMRVAKAIGAEEAVYRDPQGHITEGVTSNIHMLKDGVITSPDEGCLGGITREGLRPIAENMGLTWVDAAITTDALLAADEIWITSAVRELIPVVAVDNHPIGKGVPGTYAIELRKAYRQACLESARTDAGF